MSFRSAFSALQFGLALVFVGFLLVPPVSAQAPDRSFDGGPNGTGTSWHVPENWNPDGVPSSGEYVSPSNANVSVTFDVSIAGLQCGTSAGTDVSVADGTQLAVSAGMEGCEIENQGTVVVTGGDLDQAYVAGDTLRLSGMVNINSPFADQGARVEVTGTLQSLIAPTATNFELGSGATLVNTGTIEEYIEISTPPSGSYGTPDPFPIFTNETSGTYRGGDVNTLFTNHGTVDIPEGQQFSFYAPDVWDGTFTIGADALLDVKSTPNTNAAGYNFDGLTITGTGSVQFDGLPGSVPLPNATYDLDPESGGTTILGGTTLSFPSSMTLNSLGKVVELQGSRSFPTTVTLDVEATIPDLTMDSDVTLAGSGDLTLASAIDLNGTIQGARSVTVDAGVTGDISTLTLLGGTAVTYNAATESSGRLNLDMGDGTSFTNNGTLTYNGSVEILPTGSITTPPVFQNPGLLHINTTRASQIGVDFQNTGELRLVDLTYSAGLTVTGPFTNATGGQVRGNGDLDWSGSPQVTNEGTIETTSLRVTNDVPMTAAAALETTIGANEPNYYVYALGTATVDGTLDLTFEEGATLGTRSLVVTGSGRSGTFDQVTTTNASGYTYALDYQSNRVELDITGTPNPIFSLDDTDHDFFDVYVGTPEPKSFTITNDGSPDLQIDAIELAGANPTAFELNGLPASFPVTLGANQTVTFEADAVGPNEGNKTATIDVTHNGGGTASTASISLEADIINPHYGGGSEYDGYHFANSTTFSDGVTSNPTFDWIDISSSGTEITSDLNDDDIVAGPYALGFTFRFFGTDATEYYLDSNGWLSFASSAPSSEYSNDELPDSSDPDNLIAWFWDDLDPSNSSVADVHIYRGAATVDGQTAHVLTFEHMPERGGGATDWITAQVVLIPNADPSVNGTIKLQYKEHGAGMPLDDATVGIEDDGGQNGFSYLYDGEGGPLFGSPLAVQIGPEPSTLPVELASFDARLDDSRVRLSWTTATETNNASFDVQRRVGPVSDVPWTTLGTVEGVGTTDGASSYQFTDDALPFAADRAEYRLRQVDLDGTASLSSPVAIDLAPPAQLTLHAPFPNPVQDVATVRYTLPEDVRADVTLRLYDVMGRHMRTVHGLATAGRHELSISSRGLASGVYFVRLQAGHTHRTARFTITR